MSINFCNGGLTAEIKSDKVCFEGHELENLISNDPLLKKKGFMTDNFVRPPATVEFKFICEVNITRVVIGCSVGAQKSTSFELSTMSLLGGRKNIVGYCHVSGAEDTIVCHIHGQDPSRETRTGRVKLCTFKSSKFLSRVCGLSVKILRTQDSSVPALGRIEIWANPSRTVSAGVVKNLKTIWHNINSNTPPVFETKQPKKTEAPDLPICSDLEVPEEFLDPITWEMMTIPMALPSGKVVDITTLEKFHVEEAKYGRDKSDPFTGILFTEQTKPIVAVALKSRIDKFIIENCNHSRLKSLPRTVGKRPMAIENSPVSRKKLKTTELAESEYLPRNSKSTLDELISSSLRGLPSYLEAPQVNVFKIECAKCLLNSNLFELPCKHLLCRSCLIAAKSQSDKKCQKCNSQFKSNDPVRYHTNSIFN